MCGCLSLLLIAERMEHWEGSSSSIRKTQLVIIKIKMSVIESLSVVCSFA